MRFVWAAPITVPCFVFYILPCWMLGWYKFIARNGDAWVFVHGQMPLRLQKMWSRWSGQCVGNCIVVKTDPNESSIAFRTVRHEMVHVRQVMTWGIFQPIMYLLSSLAAKMAGLDPYKHNAFEVAAYMQSRNENEN